MRPRSIQPSFLLSVLAIDRDRGKMGRYVIMGSSSPELARTVTESLAGRAALLVQAPPASFLAVDLRLRSTAEDGPQSPPFCAKCLQRMHKFVNFCLQNAHKRT